MSADCYVNHLVVPVSLRASHDHNSPNEHIIQIIVNRIVSYSTLLILNDNILNLVIIMIVVNEILNC